MPVASEVSSKVLPSSVIFKPLPITKSSPFACLICIRSLNLKKVKIGTHVAGYKDLKNNCYGEL